MAQQDPFRSKLKTTKQAPSDDYDPYANDPEWNGEWEERRLINQFEQLPPESIPKPYETKPTQYKPKPGQPQQLPPRSLPQQKPSQRLPLKSVPGYKEKDNISYFKPPNGDQAIGPKPLIDPGSKPMPVIPIDKPGPLPSKIDISGGSGATKPPVNVTGGMQNAFDWQDFFTLANIPSIGYDPINDKLIIKKSNDYSAENSQDILVYDMQTGAWTKGVAAMTNAVDTTNFVVNGDGELVIKQGAADPNFHFLKWSATSTTSTAFNWTSKAFDFGIPTIEKKLYKVVIHAKNGANTQVKVAYDNAGSTTDIFAANTLSDATIITRNELTVSSPTSFSYLTLEISSNGTTAADFVISDISFIYRPLGAR